jgi:hypothetical protein
MNEQMNDVDWQKYNQLLILSGMVTLAREIVANINYNAAQNALEIGNTLDEAQADIQECSNLISAQLNELLGVDQS